jgi:hypothetical protein
MLLSYSWNLFAYRRLRLSLYRRSQLLDSLHNASMILSGMGPVIEINTVWGKVFSSFYALFSGIVFITNIGIILAPALHRMYHRLHLEDQ